LNTLTTSLACWFKPECRLRRWRLSRNIVYIDGNSKLANIGYPNGLRMH
jgi:hypothetical protein